MGVATLCDLRGEAERRIAPNCRWSLAARYIHEEIKTSDKVILFQCFFFLNINWLLWKLVFSLSFWEKEIVKLLLSRIPWESSHVCAAGISRVARDSAIHLCASQLPALDKKRGKNDSSKKKQRRGHFWMKSLSIWSFALRNASPERRIKIMYI